eukprot:6172889-Pleurochrysis_carterae.AAC.3
MPFGEFGGLLSKASAALEDAAKDARGAHERGGQLLNSWSSSIAEVMAATPGQLAERSVEQVSIKFCPHLDTPGSEWRLSVVRVAILGLLVFAGKTHE